MKNIIVIGGGASGLMLCACLSGKGRKVILIEKNEKLGKKLFLTGKGRCNLTNSCDIQELFQAVIHNPRFCYSAFYTFSNQDAVDFFENAGVPLKTERGGRVFPVSDHSSEIIRALEKKCRANHVEIRLQEKVDSIRYADGKVSKVKLHGGRELEADVIVVATGGLSYPQTGSTGDGYAFAVDAGHTVARCMPSLVPLRTKEDYIPRLAGLSLRNVELSVMQGKKTLFCEFGEMMFTHTGITGPLVLTASAVLGERLSEKELLAYINLKPALSEEQLDDRILRELEANSNKQFKNVIPVLFPSTLTPVILELSGIMPDKAAREVSHPERKGFVDLIRHFPVTITGTAGFREAIITKGGVSVKEIDPGTMESKKIKGLYFIGEVLDVDALTGGFNLQFAWSTAYLAAQAISKL
ncbi:MAG: NAD(P)/FAD-dependent oxidoreductase [Blautia sp.]|nr:NAD(P)/FAD-dependent oxidoreductase [Blautia sp.]